MAGALSPFTNNLGIAFLAQDFFPYLQISGNVWVAVGLPLKASYQKQEAWSRTKRRPGGVARKVGCTKRLVETPQAVRFDEVHLLTLINTREGVKISRQPALIFREQLGNEFCGRRWTRSHQILPRGLRLRSPGHDHASRTNANVTSVKVKDRSERKQFP